MSCPERKGPATLTLKTCSTATTLWQDLCGWASPYYTRRQISYFFRLTFWTPLQVRYHAMDICDQLFQRSHLFRRLVTQHLPQILEHAVGTKASR